MLGAPARHLVLVGSPSALPAVRALAAVTGEPLEEIPGTVPSLLERGAGCAFADRCRHAMPACRAGLPEETRYAGGRRRVLCWLHAGESPSTAALERLP
jgi:peptide/nickel transport system ATP-binding protein